MCDHFRSSLGHEHVFHDTPDYEELVHRELQILVPEHYTMALVERHKLRVLSLDGYDRRVVE